MGGKRRRDADVLGGRDAFWGLEEKPKTRSKKKNPQDPCKSLLQRPAREIPLKKPSKARPKGKCTTHQEEGGVSKTSPNAPPKGVLKAQ